MRNYHLFLMLSSMSSLLLFWIPNFSTISLSLNCLGEGCSANADGCFSSACKALQEKGNSRGHGSDPGSKNDESLVQGSWFKDGLDYSVGKLNEETQITCLPDCTTCEVKKIQMINLIGGIFHYQY
jgi:hypothetical protein